MKANIYTALMEQIAAKEHVSVDEVKQEILLAMEEAQQCTDPLVQREWAAIPRQQEELTVEELIAYLCKNC